MTTTHFQQTDHDVAATDLYGIVVTVAGNYFRAVYDDAVPLPGSVETGGGQIDYETEHVADAQREAHPPGVGVPPSRAGR